MRDSEKRGSVGGGARARLVAFDRRVLDVLRRRSHWLHRVTVGLLFVWFGLLKPLGHTTATSVIAKTIYWGDPATVTQLLGWWEVAIGVCLLVRPWLRAAVALMAIRVPCILLAFVLEPEILFVEIPFAPTPEGQYLIKDLLVFLAALAMAAFIPVEPAPDEKH